MNQENLSYLKEQLLKTGFGETLYPELQNQLSQQPEAFQLTLKSAYGNDSTEATLHFKRGNESDLYFFNRYELELKKEANQDITKQIFYVNKVGTISLKEGYNLLDGRAVHKTLATKEGQKYDAWVQLDFKNTKENGSHDLRTFGENYGYDLAGTLAKYPIKELSGDNRERLIKSLEKGNLQAVTFLRDGKEEKLFITPNVQYKTLNAFDAQMKQVSLKEKYTQSVSQEQSIVQEPAAQLQKQKPSLEGDHKQSQKPSRKQKIR